jgi:hypothetical protein
MDRHLNALHHTREKCNRDAGNSHLCSIKEFGVLLKQTVGISVNLLQLSAEVVLSRGKNMIKSNDDIQSLLLRLSCM